MTAWNLLGDLNWGGLLPVCDMLGIEDVELLIHQLATIRNHLSRPRSD